MFSLETIIESMKCNIKLNLNIKYPCSICRKPVLVNQKAIQCDTCNLWCHIKCDGTTLGHYNTLMLYENQIEYWNCLVCRLKFHIDIFPFTLLDNMEMLNMNNSDSTKFCKILPKFDVNCITSKFSNLNSYDIDANLPNNVNCKYYSVEEIHNMEAFNNLNIFHTNTNGLENKIDVLTEFVSSMSTSFDIIAISETSQTDENFKSNVSLKGYEVYSTPSNCSKGGVALYVNDNFNNLERTDLKIQDNLFQAVWIEIKNKNSKNIVCGCIYRHPQYNMDEFLIYLENILKKLSIENKEIYICGDFNIDLLKLDKINQNQLYYDLLCSYGFLPQIIYPTRIVENQTPSIIDNIFTNNLSEEIISGNIYINFSEHLSQFTSIKRGKIDYKNVKIFKRDYSKFSSNSFRDDVSIQKWNSEFDNVNDLFNDFLWRLEGCADRHAPIKKLTPKENKLLNKPWITPDIIKLINIRNK